MMIIFIILFRKLKENNIDIIKPQSKVENHKVLPDSLKFLEVCLLILKTVK